MNIVIGSDHAGFEMKQYIIENLINQINDYGTHSSEAVDYPDIAHRLSSDVNSEKYDFGILICGSGNGMTMTANKYYNIRCALCWNEDITKLARQHNDANIIALPSRFITKEDALKFVKIFLYTKFEGGRHQRRIEKI